MHSTTAQLSRDLGPICTEQGSKGKKIADYAIYIQPDALLKEAIRRSLRASLEKSVNQTEYDPLRTRPIAISIETRACGQNDEARAQLSVWALAQFERYHRLFDTIGDLGLALPLISVYRHEWSLFFAMESGNAMVSCFIPMVTTSLADESQRYFMSRYRLGGLTVFLDCFKLSLLSRLCETGQTRTLEVGLRS